MDTITKELFDNYLKLQRSGIMNMTDIEQGARILRCTQDEYETILWNYTALKNKFYPKSKYSYERHFSTLHLSRKG